MNNDEILNRVYSAIVHQARKGSFITFGDLARECDLIWPDDRYSLYKYLDDLLYISYECNWPAITVIVVTAENFESGDITEDTLEGFITAARKGGYTIGDPDDFAEDQRRSTFKWAQIAPDDLNLE